MRDEEGSLGRAPIGVDPLVAEDIRVDLHVLLGNCAVEAERDHHGRLRDFGLLARDHGAVGGTIAVWQYARCAIALGRAVRVLFDGARVLIAPVLAVGLLIAKDHLFFGSERESYICKSVRGHE